MTRNDTVDLVAALLRVRDEELLLSSLRLRDALDGAEASGVRAWRLYPLKKGGFAAGFTVGDRSGRTHSVYGLLPGTGDGGVSADLASPDYVDAISMQLFSPEEDPKLPSLERIRGGSSLVAAGIPVTGEGALVAYRPLGRAVLRFSLATRDGGELFLRMSASKRRHARIRNLALAADDLAERSAGSSPRLFPRVMASIENDRAIAIEGIVGQTLHEATVGEERALVRHVAESCESIAALHRSPPLDIGVHGAMDDAEATSWMLRRGVLASPDALRGFGDDLEILFEEAPSIEPDRLRVIHRDLHDKQLLRRRDGGGVVLLDSDTLALGDPALDLANLAAHLELREMQGRLGAGIGSRLARALLDVYASRMPLPAQRNLTYYTACTWLRLAGVYALRSSGHDLVPMLMDRGRDALHRLH